MIHTINHRDTETQRNQNSYLSVFSFFLCASVSLW